MARQPKSQGNEQEDEILRQLRSQGNGGGRLDSRPIDGALLAMVVALVTDKGGQIAFSKTRDGGRYVVTVWYKGFPTKGYCESVEELESNLASTIHIFAPKGEAYDEWRTYADGFR